MYTILAVDDSPFNLRVIKGMLSDYYRVFAAVSGEIAFRYLQHKTPDLILLDIVMPDMNGWMVMERLKAMPDYAKIPVIFLTSEKKEMTEVKCLRMGAYDFIAKPVVREVLLSRVGKALEAADYNRSLQMRLDEKTKELEAASLASINAMAAMIDARDSYTKGHSERVAQISTKIAENMGWDKADIERLYQTAILHDVGKIGVPDKILLKPSSLTEEEMAVMKTHTIMGANILNGIKTVEDLELGAKYHHERYDGSGYPEGLKGTDIPLLARIIGVADAFDAMSSNRCYRPKLEREKIHKEMLRCSGRQFDPEVVYAFLKSWEELIASGMYDVEDTENSGEK